MFSIIVPAYNCSQTLDRCIKSILKQKYCEFELLLIDDGSIDGTAEICNSLAQQDSRIVVFHKNNGGVSSARNIGLDNATGEWILFVDSDDELHEEALSLYELATKKQNLNQVEIIVSNIAYVHNDGSKTIVYDDNIDTLDTLYKQRLWGSVWNKVFSKALIDKYAIRFDETIHLSEDYLFVAEYCTHVSDLRYISVPCYFQYAPEISYKDKYKDHISFSNQLQLYSKIKKVNPLCSTYMVDGLTMSLLRELNLSSNHNKDVIISQFKQIVGQDIQYSLGKKKCLIRALSYTDCISLWKFVFHLYLVLHWY